MSIIFHATYLAYFNADVSVLPIENHASVCGKYLQINGVINLQVAIHTGCTVAKIQIAFVHCGNSFVMQASNISASKINSLNFQ